MNALWPVAIRIQEEALRSDFVKQQRVASRLFARINDKTGYQIARLGYVILVVANKVACDTLDPSRILLETLQ